MARIWSFAGADSIDEARPAAFRRKDGCSQVCALGFQCPLAMVHSRTRSRHAAFPSAVAMAAGFVPRNVASQAAWLAGRLLILAIRLIGGRLLLAALPGSAQRSVSENYAAWATMSLYSSRSI